MGLAGGRRKGEVGTTSYEPEVMTPRRKSATPGKRVVSDGRELTVVGDGMVRKAP